MNEQQRAELIEIYKVLLDLEKRIRSVQERNQGVMRWDILENALGHLQRGADLVYVASHRLDSWGHPKRENAA